MIDRKKIIALLEPFSIVPAHTERLDGYISENYLVVDAENKKFVLKNYADPADFTLIHAETSLIQSVSGKLPFKVPDAIPVQNSLLFVYTDGSFSRLMPFIEGLFFAEADHSDELLINLGKAAASLDLALKDLRNADIESRKLFWDIQHYRLSKPRIGYIRHAGQRKLVEYFFDQLEQFACPEFPFLPHSIIHNDFNDWNILTEGNNITGLLDFGDIAYSPRINELAIAITYAILAKENPVAAAKKIIEGYQSAYPFSAKEIQLLYYLIPARLCISVCSSAEAKSARRDSDYVLISEKPAWDLLERWITLSPVLVKNEFLSAAGFNPVDLSPSKEQAVLRRKKYFSPAMGLSYREPVHITSSAFQYMYDADGNTYLDAYNNIPLVGHCHPYISRAISNQARLLNTNTRYHYTALGSYAEKLLSYFPEKLNKVFFVNSGSAATDLAIRLAKNFTGRDHQLVLKHGYHGNTQIGIDISSYKFDGRGGKGNPEITHTLPLPKIYNGTNESGRAYAAEAINQIEELMAKNIIPAFFIAEMISGCGGQVPLADQYLKILFPFLQKNKILLIADEVQTGFGRLGHHFWGFEMQGIIPDLVILGKPMANGHPMGAVVTTTEIADAFANGMEFFSSFGGNPVSCEAARAVLHILEEEQLQQQAAETGDYYIALLNDLQKKYPVLGDIRGSGLFLGVEFITEKNEPNTELASVVVNRLKDNFILTSTDGPFNNVLKSKPPLCFTKKNAKEVVTRLDEILKAV